MVVVVVVVGVCVSGWGGGWILQGRTETVL